MIRNFILGACLLCTVGGTRGDDIIVIEEEPNLEGVQLGEGVMAGNGCRHGTVFSTLDLEASALLVFMDDYAAQAGGSTTMARKNCALSVPLKLPPGVQVALVSTRLEGFNLLPDGASSVLNAEAFIAGAEGELVSERFEGELYEDFVVENTSPIGGASSECGGVVNLRINTSLRVRTNAFGDTAWAAVTALGVGTSPVVQKLKFRKCAG